MKYSQEKLDSIKQSLINTGYATLTDELSTIDYDSLIPSFDSFLDSSTSSRELYKQLENAEGMVDIGWIPKTRQEGSFDTKHYLHITTQGLQMYPNLFLDVLNNKDISDETAQFIDQAVGLHKQVTSLAMDLSGLVYNRFDTEPNVVLRFLRYERDATEPLRYAGKDPRLDSLVDPELIKNIKSLNGLKPFAAPHYDMSMLTLALKEDKPGLRLGTLDNLVHVPYQEKGVHIFPGIKSAMNNYYEPSVHDVIPIIQNGEIMNILRHSIVAFIHPSDDQGIKHVDDKYTHPKMINYRFTDLENKPLDLKTLSLV